MSRSAATLRRRWLPPLLGVLFAIAFTAPAQAIAPSARWMSRLGGAQASSRSARARWQSRRGFLRPPSLAGDPLAGRAAAGETVRPLVSGAGQITGTVTSAETPAGLEGIQVCAFKPPESFGLCVLTKSQGNYEIPDLPAGQYVVEFAVPFQNSVLNYAPQYYDGQTSEEDAKAVEVTAGKATPDINAKMQKGGQITGTVTSAETRGPIAGIEVCANPPLGVGLFRCASTESDGNYTISSLGTGEEYEVGFFVPFESEKNFLPQYYDGVPLFSEPTPVPVVAGTTTSKIDAAMETGGQITGEVKSASTGAAIEGIEVCAESSEGEFFECATTKAGGRYTISALPTAEYIVGFFGEGYVAQFYNGKSLETEANLVKVTAGSPSQGINATMHVPNEAPPPPTPTPPSPPPAPTPSPVGGVVAFTAVKPPDATVTAIKSKSGGIYVSLHCPATNGSCVTAAVEVTIVEQLRHGRVTALAAATAAKTTRRTVVIGKLDLTMSAGQTETVEISLTATGRKLLAEHKKIPVKVRVEASGTSIATQILTISEPAKSKKA